MACSMFCLIAALVVRSQNAAYFALSNMYESMMVLVIGIQGAFLMIDRWFRIPAMAWPVSLMVLLAIVWDISLPTEIHPLQAALQSYWRAIHVPVIILSYAMFTLAFISSIIYLCTTSFGKHQNARPALAGPMGSDGLPSEISPFESLPSADTPSVGSIVTPSSSSGQTQLMDSALIYDEITYRCIAFGFPLLTIGIILGGMWANEAWGNYWSWDPKESMSLVTLLGYGVYLHMRVNREHSPRSLALVSVIGFILMLITYFGVNLMGVGLHSYGKIG
jgi:cytochrome c-type biogenesis protein CcsB